MTSIKANETISKQKNSEHQSVFYECDLESRFRDVGGDLCGRKLNNTGRDWGALGHLGGLSGGSVLGSSHRAKAKAVSGKQRRRHRHTGSVMKITKRDGGNHSFST
uniref:Uncharacterized protein n=1 Tax=Tenebrio molitor TaxID=7067 RepID=A0A8J6H593_TENMO|nr:hypothetical protein GEV33_015247 [Tenebrio molitor]KAH0807547.1 hypothetical protein GEV33_015242 [Tenebrio molitor]